jgi:hypothetical protein
METLTRLASNSSSPNPLFRLEYEMDSLDVLFAFEFSMAAELEDQTVSYSTEISIGDHTYSLTYLIYATPE